MGGANLWLDTAAAVTFPFEADGPLGQEQYAFTCVCDSCHPGLTAGGSGRVIHHPPSTIHHPSSHLAPRRRLRAAEEALDLYYRLCITLRRSLPEPTLLLPEGYLYLRPRVAGDGEASRGHGEGETSLKHHEETPPPSEIPPSQAADGPRT